jgi:topoisomerase-4 subunit A
MLGEDNDSRIELLSDRAEATFRVYFADENKAPLDILMAEFIDEKSAKAKGKRVTTLEVARIEDITPEPEPEPEPEVELEDEAVEEVSETTDSTSIDIDGVKMTIEKPKDTQLDLF